MPGAVLNRDTPANSGGGPATATSPTRSSTTAADAQSSVTAAAATTASPPLPVWVTAALLAFISYVLPLLDRLDHLRGWVEGKLFGFPSAPVQATGRDAVVLSGASTGIGFDTALTLARSGVLVFAGVRREADAAKLLAAADGASTLVPIMLDVASEASIAQAVARVTAELAARNAQLVGIVNNAGIPRIGHMEDETVASVNRIFAVNVYGPMLLTNAFLPLVHAHGRGGRVVLIASLASIVTGPLNGVYSATLFDGYRLDLAPRSIGVSTIHPGSIDTVLWDKFNRVDSAQGTAFDQKLRTVAKATAIPPSHVTRSIVHALTATVPCPRYVVGLDARIGDAFARKVPIPLLDRIMLSSLRG
ncbi:hypothetical protein H9P43_004602 [Blastocladiella emersonii ATCC 22665]|nr:hypothetical protein H9P43_004602 [Blastocladiella emersonii ATCC 22665]